MKPFEDYSRIRFSRDGRVLSIILHGTTPMNAVDGEMHHELSRVFIEAQDDADSDLVILTAEGRAFCAGGDAAWFKAQIEDPRNFRAITPQAKRIINSLLDLEKPIVCRLNGAAAGLGASIALLCDVIVANEAALIGDPHVRVGLVAGDGGAVIWPQLIGFARAKEFLLTGEMLSAKRAAEMGLINYAVPADQLDSKVAEVVSKILANPRWAVRWTKTAANIPLKMLANQISDAAIAYEILSNLTTDRREAVAAFVEKRKPVFGGE